MDDELADGQTAQSMAGKWKRKALPLLHVFSLVFVYDLIQKVLNPFRNQSCFQKGICFHRDTVLLQRDNTLQLSFCEEAHFLVYKWPLLQASDPSLADLNQREMYAQWLWLDSCFTLTSYSQTSVSKSLRAPIPKSSCGIVFRFSQRNVFITMQISLGIVDLKHSPYFISESVNAINGTSFTRKRIACR